MAAAASAAVAPTTIEPAAVKPTVTVAAARVVSAMRAVCAASCRPDVVAVEASWATPSPTLGNRNARDGCNRADDDKNDEDEAHHKIAVS
jgi:hypothetical protein